MDIPEKGSDSGICGGVLATCLRAATFAGLELWGYKGARSDTFHAADRLERTRGIYWLCYTGSGGVRIAYISFSLFLSPSTYSTSLESQLSPSFSGAAQKMVIQNPRYEIVCLPLRHLLTRLSQFGMSPCALFCSLQDAWCMTHEMIRAARPRPHARPHACMH